MKRFLLIHPDDGIFIGTGLGMAFWSKLDSGGQTKAFTFESIEHAQELLSKFDPPRDVENFELEPIETDGPYVTVNQITEAGFDGW